MVKKNCKDMCNRLQQYRRVTDGQTDGRTDTLPLHSPRYAYASRGNKTIHTTFITLVYSGLSENNSKTKNSVWL